MKVVIKQSGLTELIATMLQAKQKIGEQWKKDVYAEMTRALQLVKERRNAGETTDIATAARTGRLRDSYVFTPPELRNGRITTEIGVTQASEKGEALEYAATHEFGATIKPVNGRYLAIPMKDALTANGIPRGKPRDFENTFVAKTKGGNLMIMQRKVGSTDVVPLFFLTKGPIKIKPRPSLRPAMEAVAPDIAERLFRSAKTIIAESGRA